jgi:hypothetical protein
MTKGCGYVYARVDMVVRIGKVLTMDTAIVYACFLLFVIYCFGFS